MGKKQLGYLALEAEAPSMPILRHAGWLMQIKDLPAACIPTLGLTAACHVVTAAAFFALSHDLFASVGDSYFLNAAQPTKSWHEQQAED